MKTQGSSYSSVYQRSAVGVSVALIMVACISSIIPLAVHADTPQCGEPPSLLGSYFTDYQSDEYSPSGFLIEHFKKNPAFPYTLPIRLVPSLFDDACTPVAQPSPFLQVTLPPEVTDWSIRFASSTEFAVWDDQHDVIIATSTIASHPTYASVTFSGFGAPDVIYNGQSFTAHTEKIQRDGEPPLVTGTLPTPAGCSSMFVYGDVFDPTYEHAEYVDHLLRVHLRVRSLQSGGLMRVYTRSLGPDCTIDASAYQPSWVYGFTPENGRYYSYRMTSPTHWTLWDDERDVLITCDRAHPEGVAYACQGDIDPSVTTYISWYADIGGGTVAILATTPHPPVEQVQTCTPGVDPDCNDNVLFLPGIEASRLYRPDYSGGTNQLWEPTSDSDARDLFMIADGSSSRPDIYTKDLIDEAYGTINIYKSFLTDLETWKNTEHIIADYSAVPYDWRLTLDEILDYGHEMPDGRLYYSGDLRATSTPYIIQELTRLAASSRTGKVTIVAHSNGGLVAKALMKRLQDTHNPLLDKIDVIVMVAVPQTGTPHALGAVLHGYDQGIPKDWLDFALSKEVAREFAYNDPMVHHLLPSVAYFNSDGATVRTPPITFEDGTATQTFIDTYGHVIGNDVELRDFLLGVEGRPLPASDELNNPTVLRSNLLAYGEGVHASLDAWVPPAGVTVHQIAGWGEDTAAGIVYSSDRKCRVISGFRCMEYADTLRHKPDMVVDGDGTVVAPSALAMSTSTDQVKRWWVNLKQFNADHHPTRALPNVNHASILEISELRLFIESMIIASSSSPLPRYVRETIPPVDDAARLRFFLHSPLALSVTDVTGQEISASTSTIPGARYKRFGEVQYISVPASAAPTLHLDGFATGSFTLEVQEATGDTVTATTTFLGIPNATTTTASMNFGDGTIENASPLVVDIDADGTTDITLEPKVGEMIVPDTTPPEIQITFATSTNTIAFIGTDDMGTTTISATTTYPALKKHQKEAGGIATTTVTVRDLAGNTTVLVYTEKLPSPKQRETITLQELAYNAATTTLAGTSISYKWRLGRDDSYKIFASHIRTPATTTESHYRPKKNITVVMTKPVDLDDEDSDDDVDSRPIRQKFPGMIIPSVVTEKGRALVIY